MPKEYLDCKKKLINQGKSEKDAARICAISYYKKHGKRPQDVHSDYENGLFTLIEAVFHGKFVKE